MTYNLKKRNLFMTNKKQKKVLLVLPHRLDRSPGQRFRIEQYLRFLEQNGYEFTVSNIISKEDDQIFYNAGHYFSKFRIFFKSFCHRIKDIRKADDFDIIFIYREAIMLGTTYFERKFSKSKAKIIFDFDDSIWLNDVSDGNKNLKWLKRPSKTKTICKYSDTIFAGNAYLANFAAKYNSNVKIIPTTIDTDYHLNKNKKTSEKICIGWTGTSTTLKHLEFALPVLEKIKAKYGEKIIFKVIVNTQYEIENLGIKATPWSLKTEIEDLSEINIGIMPLPDDEWANGKCGFKGIQYMSLEIPTIMSPVGVNTEIISDGENGFLADGLDEWLEKLSILIENPDLREKMGKAGRKTVIEKYSVESQKSNYLKYFDELIS